MPVKVEQINEYLFSDTVSRTCFYQLADLAINPGFQETLSEFRIVSLLTNTVVVSDGTCRHMEL